MKGLTTSQIAELNLKHAKNHLIVGDSAEPRLLHELKAKGCNVVKAIKGQGSITYGIALLQDYDLIVEENSINLIKELNNYSWLEKKSKTPTRPLEPYYAMQSDTRYHINYKIQIGVITL